MKNIILANAPEYNGNMGCVALCYTMLFLIDELFTENGASYRLFLTDSNSPKRKNVVKIAGKTIHYDSIINPLPLSLKNCIKKVLLFPSTLRSVVAFRRADCILDIGQGDSFSDIYGIDRFNRIDSIHKAARRFRKPYCFLPQTIGPFKSDWAKNRSHESLKRAAIVMARDKMSCQYVLDKVPEQKHVCEYIDVAFLLPYCQQSFETGYVHVGLNVSALLWNGGYVRNNQFELKDDYQTIIRAIIDYFLEKEDVKIHLIPHVMSPSFIIEDDSSVCEELVKTYQNDRLVKSPNFSSPTDAKSYISGMDFFVGARMHATIAAFSSGVPVVPMAYSRKFNGLFQETLCYSQLIDLKKDSQKEILQTIHSAFSNREQLKKEIERITTDKIDFQIDLLKRDLASFMGLKHGEKR